MSVVRTTFVGSTLNGSAIFDNDGLCDNGSVDQEVVCILEHEGVCGEFLSFFDRNGHIGTNMQVCTNVTAAKGDYILSVAFNKERSEVKAECIMGNDEQSHDPSGFKLIEDDMTVFFPSVRKTIPFTGIFRDDGYKSVVLSHVQSTDFACIGEAIKIRTIFRHLLYQYSDAFFFFFVKLFYTFFKKNLLKV